MAFRCTRAEPFFGFLQKANGITSGSCVTFSGHIMSSHFKHLSGGLRGTYTGNVHEAQSHSVIREVRQAPRREEPVNHRR